MFELIRRRGFAGAVSTVSVLATMGAGVLLAPAASADRIVKGCRIVANPTREHHTVCPHHYLGFAILSSENLSYANLGSADLRLVDLSGANLSDANLSDAYLGGADLRTADLHGADLRGAGLSFARGFRIDLRGADLRGADLYKADLRDADLRNADLRDVALYDADLRGAKFCHTKTSGGEDNSDCFRMGHRIASGR